jgi:hypothetical protein
MSRLFYRFEQNLGVVILMFGTLLFFFLVVYLLKLVCEYLLFPFIKYDSTWRFILDFYHSK